MSARVYVLHTFLLSLLTRKGASLKALRIRRKKATHGLGITTKLVLHGMQNIPPVLLPRSPLQHTHARTLLLRHSGGFVQGNLCHGGLSRLLSLSLSVSLSLSREEKTRLEFPPNEYKKREILCGTVGRSNPFCVCGFFFPSLLVPKKRRKRSWTKREREKCIFLFPQKLPPRDN